MVQRTITSIVNRFQSITGMVMTRIIAINGSYRPGGIMDQAVDVAEVKEDESAQVTAPMDPATEANGGTDVGAGQATGAMRAK